MDERCRIKQLPEDFLVREILDIKARLGPGRFSYYLLRKRGYTTQKAVELVARAFGKRIKFVNFSGNKDRQAVTEQFISILHGPSRDLQLEGVSLKYLGRGRDRINLGEAEGNEFEIVVRNLNKEWTMSKAQDTDRFPAGNHSGIRRPPGRHSKENRYPIFPNYYDEQRFGKDLDNHLVGKHIVKREFREAALRIPECRGWLSTRPNDFVGALRSLPRRVLRIYAHSYQSWLWNRTASEILAEGPHRMVKAPMGKLAFPLGNTHGIQIPIVGYETSIRNDRAGRIIKRLLAAEDISQEDFRMSQFPEFDLRGGQRSLLAEVRNLEIGDLEKNDLGKGDKLKLRFSLPKGSYATMVVRALFS
jgi:tRNA pseudouridine13 synthase